MPPFSLPRLGVSSCLLGQNVRHDGNHKRHPFLMERLAHKVELVAVCPEVEMGLGIPREPIELVSHGRAVRLLTVADQSDLTARMKTFATRRARELKAMSLDGYVLKSRSPSCGLADVPVRHSSRRGQGLFAQALVRSLEDLPITEETALDRAETREVFLVRIYAAHRLRELFHAKWTLPGLVRFHTLHKLLLLAHDPASYQRLGRLVGHAKSLPRSKVVKDYSSLFQRLLIHPATHGRQMNVLEHIAGYFRQSASSKERAQIRTALEAYGRAEMPLAKPRTLLHRLARRHEITYLVEQLYFEPYPEDLRWD